MAVLVVLCAVPGQVSAVTPAVLVDRTLEAQRVRVTAMGDGRISFFDGDRRLQHAPLEAFVQLRAIGDDDAEPVAAAAVAPGDGAVLILTDGQRIAGRWTGPADDGESLGWSHEVLGELRVRLDDIRGFGEAQATVRDAVGVRRDGPPTQDYAVLTNGDVIRGFLTEVTDGGVALQPDGVGEAIDLAASRIAHVMLANPDEPTPRGRHTLVLIDGSVIHAQGLALRRGALRFETRVGGSGRTIELPIEAVRRIDFTAGSRLVRLIDLPREVSGGEVFGLALRPWVEGVDSATGQRDTGALRMNAPVTVTFELPEHAARLAAVAELATGPDAPADLLDWADFELRVDAGGEVLRHRLYRKNPAVSLNVPITGGSLRLELDDGVNGPVLDRMRLRHAVVLIEPPEDR